MTQPNFMTLTVKAIPENVGLVRLAVAVFASQLPFAVHEIDEIKVAVSEAVTNAVVHAYPEGGGIVEVRAQIGEDGLTVIVRDEGIGIADLELARQNGYSSDPERLGMGFYFMEELMDSVEVESQPGRGTRVVLRRRPDPTAQPQQDAEPAVG
ncbi:MAG TPA: anti-sigma F factor [Bacillota bacterium]